MKQHFTIRVFISALIVLTAAFLLTRSVNKEQTTQQNTKIFAMPGEGGKEEGEDHEKKKELWWASMHRTAPGADWKALDVKNREMLIQQKQMLKTQHVESFAGDESFANGKITGQWSERGNANIAGSAIAVDYIPETDYLYTITSGGSLWKGKRDGSQWQVLNDDRIFASNDLCALQKPGGGTRILTHTDFGSVMYSDDEGKNFINCGGEINDISKFDFYFVKRYFTAKDAVKTIYAETFGYDITIGTYAVSIYTSTDQGASFSKTDVLSFPGYTPDNASAHMAYNSNDVFTVYLSPGTVVTTKISGASVNKKVAFVSGINGFCNLKAVNMGGFVTMYMLVNNVDVYRSSDEGSSWAKTGSLPFTSWNRLDVSQTNATHLFAGAVNATRSYNSGSNWTTVNEWYEYYSNIPGKLHADIMEIKQFRQQNTTPFTIINNHGGCAVSYDDLITTSNISLSGLYNAQYYDVLTNPAKTNEVYGGTQDQGWQISTAANTPGVLNMTQQISGDYGHLALTANNKNLWTEYPGGWLIYYTNPAFNITPGSYTLPGSQKPLYEWILPTAAVSQNEDAIYIAGGNITGGNGSYLVRVDAVTNGSSVSFNAKQFNYDFRNASGGTAGISAIEPSVMDTKQIYVGTENGLFYYTKDSGATWNQSSLGSGPEPWYLYGNSIYASKKDKNFVWYAGSGYSNAPVWESKNGGSSFSAMSNGLPQTLVFEICASDDETLLFAGTAAGPYVYVREDKKWYSLTGVETPLQDYVSVEYISSSQTVRFATFGRGIWDFKITNLVLPVAYNRFTATPQNSNVSLDWATASESNTSRFDIQRSADAIRFSTIGSVVSKGISTGSSYSYTDANVLGVLKEKKIYYRIASVDKDGKTTNSKVLSVENIYHALNALLAPNPANNITTLSLTNVTGKASIVLTDLNGKQIWQITTTSNKISIDLSHFAAGNYLVIIKDDKETRTLKLVKE